jgi:tRNA nucleotidyltransferase (CCA-adding enzyme)
MTVAQHDIPTAVLGICRTLADRGHGAWIVGGCVRDLLLGRPPHDWDVCTTALPTEMLDIFPGAIPTGLAHGTVTVLRDRVPFEVTTLRGESGYSDGRHPDEVRFVRDIVEDLARRDFTVNAMAFDPTKGDGDLVDPFAGQADLAARAIRAVGDPVARFGEDGLRVLRAARFAATLEFDLDPATAAAIPGALPVLRKVSAERVRDEWLKAFLARVPSRAFEVMRAGGILAVVCPELLEGVGCTQNHWHSFDVWTHTMLTLDGVAPDPLLRAAALLHDIAKPRTRSVIDECMGPVHFYGHEKLGAQMADAWLRAYRFPVADREAVVHLVRNHLVLYERTWTSATVRRFMRRVGLEAMPRLMALCRADARAKGPELARTVAANLLDLDDLQERMDVQSLPAEKPLALSLRDLAVDGHDLMCELGLAPGREVGRLLEALLERVLEDPGVNERERLLGLARELGGKEGTQ